MSTKTIEYAKYSVSSIKKIMEMSVPTRIYFETEETVTKKSKGWIEVENDFTQVYNQFWRIAASLKSLTTIKLLFWLLSHEANKENGIRSGKIVFDKFNADLESEGIDKVGLRTFNSSFDELLKLETLTRVGKGHYYFNPHVFWKDGKKERLGFITDEVKEKKYISKNMLRIKDKDAGKKRPTISIKSKP